MTQKRLILSGNVEAVIEAFNLVDDCLSALDRPYFNMTQMRYALRQKLKLASDHLATTFTAKEQRIYSGIQNGARVRVCAVDVQVFPMVDLLILLKEEG